MFRHFNSPILTFLYWKYSTETFWVSYLDFCIEKPSYLDFFKGEIKDKN